MEERDALIASMLAQTGTNHNRLSGLHAPHYRKRRRLCLICCTCFRNSYRFRASAGYVQCVLHPNLPRTRGFPEELGNKIGRITPGGHITEYSLLTPNARPYGITPGLDGALWFTEYATNEIGRISTGGIPGFSIPTPGAIPYGISKGPDGAL